ncbi:phosphatidylglycerol lysyltransferase domain-containing protein [Fusobacterium pseudoperiodonticum]|uniref:DUF2156 domain-containing protein n=1 Tax=Fusobacterium pseudoperiodonticum TaxID=2663009 RepID=UPI0028D828A6|nr:phosphatidylglycerol lysyltransferase domain-containing protein [Fusobacterium pseudoperiodonticum]
MWKKLTIESKNTIEEYTKNRFEICDLSFSNLFLWSFGENTEYEIENDVLTIRSEYMGEVYYYMPIPKNDTPENIAAMKEKIKKIIEENVPIHYFTEYWYEKLKDDFNLQEKRDYEDYIYSYESLSTLKGRHYAKKKNRVANFRKNYEYSYESISKDNIEEVIAFQEKWYKLHSEFGGEILKNENEGIMQLLKNYDSLDIKGGFLKVNNQIIAYSLGEALNDKIVLVHTEKALIDYIGSYQAINMIYLQEEWQGYELVNREDDFGDEGLREAKMSYKPLYLLKKYSIEKNV